LLFVLDPRPPVPPVVPVTRVEGAGGREAALDLALARLIPVPELAAMGTSSSFVDFFFFAELSTFRV
jgi:hypothetical protein